MFTSENDFEIYFNDIKIKEINNFEKHISNIKNDKNQITIIHISKNAYNVFINTNIKLFF